MFVRNKQHLVVDCYPPARVRLLWLAILALLAALAWSILGYAPALVSSEMAATEQQQITRLERFSHAESERKRLAAEVRRLTTMQQVDQRAYALLQENFTSLQEEIVGLEEQLAFYQAVVAPDESKPGLKIERFDISALGSNEFEYTLVLLQSRKDRGTVKGSFTLNVQGTLEGRRASLSMAEISTPSVANAKVRFRYFQNIHGRIGFPSGFVPQRVSLKLDVNQPHKDVKKSYSWDGSLSD